MKTLVLAEKKSQADDLSKGLVKYGGSFKSGNRFLENADYIITWAEGHVMSIMEPRDHENWGDRKWQLEALPWYPPNFEFTYKVGKDRVYNQLKPIFARKDIGEVIVATDAGREGTLIAHELIDHFEMKVPVKRFYESAVLTPKNIQHIIENDLKDSSFVVPRKKAAYARAFADLLLGMNFTIGFTAKANAFLSMGRVKTPTMAILAQRKQEILNFREEKYFELEADFDGVYKGLWFKEKLGNTKFASKDDVLEMKKRLKGMSGQIVKKEVIEKPENPKLFFNLNDLQGEANSRFGFDPSETLDIAQSLYDTHKILSYPRSESRVIGSEHEKLLPGILEAIKVEPYDVFVEDILKRNVPTNNRIVNDKKLSDHHALIPTEVTPDLSKLNANERKVYDMVVKRFLAAFYPVAMYEKTEVVTEVDGETFKTSGRIEVDKGWKIVYGGAVAEEEEDKEEESTLPPIEEGEERKVNELLELDKKTSPPKLYTYKQLLNAMESPKRFLQTKELKEALDSAEADAGLGTSATRGDILKDLMNKEYIEKKGKNVDITDFGMKLVEVSPERLKSPEITAEWEGKLRRMEIGKYDFDLFMGELREYIETILSELGNSELTVSFPNRNGASGEEIVKCPHCGSGVRDIGKAYACEKSSVETPCFIVSKKIGKKEINQATIKELVEKGETKIIKGFVGKSGKKFDAKLKIENKKITFDFNGDDIALCPNCKKPIAARGSIYMCETNSRENPCFIVNKQMLKKNISPTAIKELAEKNITPLIKGFTSPKTGNKFDAKLKLEGNKVVFEFEKKNSSSPAKATNLSCPFCTIGKIQENAKAFGCNNWKDGCKFTLWKNGTALKMKHIENLIQNGETGRIDGLKRKAGTTFSASYKLDSAAKTIITDYIND